MWGSLSPIPHLGLNHVCSQRFGETRDGASVQPRGWLTFRRVSFEMLRVLCTEGFLGQAEPSAVGVGLYYIWELGRSEAAPLTRAAGRESPAPGEGCGRERDRPGNPAQVRAPLSGAGGENPPWCGRGGCGSRAVSLRRRRMMKNSVYSVITIWFLSDPV